MKDSQMFDSLEARRKHNQRLVHKDTAVVALMISGLVVFGLTLLVALALSFFDILSWLTIGTITSGMITLGVLMFMLLFLIGTIMNYVGNNTK